MKNGTIEKPIELTVSQAVFLPTPGGVFSAVTHPCDYAYPNIELCLNGKVVGFLEYVSSEGQVWLRAYGPEQEEPTSFLLHHVPTNSSADGELAKAKQLAHMLSELERQQTLSESIWFAAIEVAGAKSNLDNTEAVFSSGLRVVSDENFHWYVRTPQNTAFVRLDALKEIHQYHTAPTCYKPTEHLDAQKRLIQSFADTYGADYDDDVEVSFDDLVMFLYEYNC